MQVLAIQINEPFTANVSWSKEPLMGKPKGWLIQYNPGDFGIVDEEIFNETYDVIHSA